MPHKIPDEQMLPKAATVTKAYTDEAHQYLLSLLPTPGRYRDAKDRYLASYNAALQGGPEEAAACEADRKELDRIHALLVGLAKLAAPQDPTVPEKLGLGPLTTKSSGPPLIPKPVNFNMTHGTIEGEMIGGVSSSKGVRMWEIWGCDGDPNIEANWRLLAASPNCKGIEIKGLIPGVKYWFRIRGIRGNEKGPWSNYLTIRAL